MDHPSPGTAGAAAEMWILVSAVGAISAPGGGPLLSDPL
jgi:hypothetical protein